MNTRIDEHDAWCKNQHEQVKRSVAKIYTRLGTIENTLQTQSKTIESSSDKLDNLNSWAQKRDGATKALMWVAGISGTIIAFLALIFKLTP